MKRKPYQIDDSGKYWDYSFKIKGIIYEVSVSIKDGTLYITKDTDQNKPNEYYV